MWAKGLKPLPDIHISYEKNVTDVCRVCVGI